MRSVSQRFEALLDRYRHGDGRRWSGQELQDATGGVVTRSYVSMLRKGNIGNPGFEKLRAIAKVMGFPPEAWFEDVEDRKDPNPENGDDASWSVAERLNRLFETVTNGRTGRPYTSADASRMSLGDLTEEEVEDIRTGRAENPTVAQVLALSDVFGVHPSYFLDTGKKPPLLDAQAMEVLGDQKSRAIANKSLDLSDGEKDLVIEMIERLGHLHDADGSG